VYLIGSERLHHTATETVPPTPAAGIPLIGG
jgi:hypothetical protein